MISARIAVRYEGDWTADFAEFNAFGKFLAYTFQDNRYYALVTLTADDIDETLVLLRDHQNVMDVTVVDRTPSQRPYVGSVTLTITSTHHTLPPMEMLAYKGYLPTGNPSLENGQIYFDLILEDLEELSQVKELLDRYGDVTVVYLSTNLLYQLTPAVDEFDALMKSLSPRQSEILLLAVERGYFAETRDVTMQSLAEELDISMTTAAEHFRRGWKKVMLFAYQHTLPYTERYR